MSSATKTLAEDSIIHKSNGMGNCYFQHVSVVRLISNCYEVIIKTIQAVGGSRTMARIGRGFVLTKTKQKKKVSIEQDARCPVISRFSSHMEGYGGEGEIPPPPPPTQIAAATSPRQGK